MHVSRAFTVLSVISVDSAVKMVGLVYDACDVYNTHLIPNYNSEITRDNCLITV